MNLNARLEERVVLCTSEIGWMGTPSDGVQRRLLERDGTEAARATSIVRYLPLAAFTAHDHPGGEEIFVIDGEFADEGGVYGPWTYLRNPAGSGHAPWSPSGCTLFVKLGHLNPDDRRTVVVDTRRQAWQAGLAQGLTVMPLAAYGSESTALVRWQPGTRFSAHRHGGGEEVLVLEGVFEDEHGRYPAGTWIRSPQLSQHRPFSTDGCTILVKTGHLDPLETRVS